MENNAQLFSLTAELQSRTFDAVLWKSDELLGNVRDADEIAGAQEQVCVMLSCISNQLKREHYIKLLCKKYKWKETTIAKIVNELIEEEKASDSVYLSEEYLPLPKHVNRDEYLRYGFYEETEKGKAGYYFHTSGRNHTKQSTFIMKPLFHVNSRQDSKDLIEIFDGDITMVVEIPGKALVSLDQFVGIMWDSCKALFFGNKPQLMRVLDKMSKKFTDVWELKTLGWQQEGFFSYSNMVFNGELKQLDNYGVVEVGKKKYYSPSVSSINLDQRADDDEYENDRYLTYRPSPITFEEWCALMGDVYRESHAGKMGIAFVFIALFRDLVFKVDNNSPLMSCYGQKGSGKSKFAESLQNLFLTDLQPFNLSHGTEFAFFNRLSRFRNCITWFDEFDDNAIKEDRFQSIKGAYDGSGRERGKGTTKNKTEIARINSALLLTGQYLSTRDDNAALTRCIILAFKPRGEGNRFTRKEIEQYTSLKEYERKGLSGMLPEILQHRKELEKFYAVEFAGIFQRLRDDIETEKNAYNERVLRNYTALTTMIKFFAGLFKLGFSYEDFFAIVKSEVVQLSALISSSDALADFWNTVVYLLEVKQIEEGFHFKIRSEQECELNGRQEKFMAVKKLIFIRLTTIHKLYGEAYRRQHGRNGVDFESLKLYISSHKAYLGSNKNNHFSRRIRMPDGTEKLEVSKTSSFVFDYELLGVDLQRTEQAEPVSKISNPDDRTEAGHQEELPLPKDLPF